MLTSLAQAQDTQAPQVERIATGLQNPRGVAVLPDGRLLVAQAGMGIESRNPSERTGSLNIFEDRNGDGDYDDAGEITPILTQIASYNSLTRFSTSHDEVNGIVDLVLMDDGRIFYTKDDPSAEVTDLGDLRGDSGVFWVSLDGQEGERLISRPATTNALAYDPAREVFYLAESGIDRVSTYSLNGERLSEVQLSLLAHDQHPVPAGLALDPDTGDVLVALFSGFVNDYYGTVLAFMPGDAKIIRLNPETGEFRDEITNLTAAVDVAIDEFGNIYVVELTIVWSSELVPIDFPLFDPNAPPDAGGYARYTGRVTMYPADGGEPVVLASQLDEPTNVTYHDGALYISTGQGTPGRRIFTPFGEARITGEIYRITNFLPAP
jgi:sugar lactone lactonase YvrE